MEASFLAGVRRMSRGIRSGNAGVAAVGAAVAAWALIRRTDPPREQQVQVLRVKPGDEIRVVVPRQGQRTR